MLKANKYVQSIRILNLSLKELTLTAKNRGIKGYTRMFNDKLLSMLNTPEPIKGKNLSIKKTKYLET